MSMALVLLVVCVLLLAYGGLAAPAIFAGALFVGFWLLVLRIMIGFGRWVAGGGRQSTEYSGLDTPRRKPARNTGEAAHLPIRGAQQQLCRHPRCGHVNVSMARFCARCGRPLAASRRAYPDRAA